MHKQQWWLGLPCHLLVLVHCVFWSPVNAAIYQDILEHMLPSADKLYGDADFIFQQDLAPAHTTKGTKSWFNNHGVGVLDWPANSPDLNPIENQWGIVKRKMGYCHQTQQFRWPEGRYQTKLGFHYTRVVPQADCLHYYDIQIFWDVPVLNLFLFFLLNLEPTQTTYAKIVFVAIVAFKNMEFEKYIKYWKISKIFEICIS